MCKVRWLCAMVSVTLAVTVVASGQETRRPRARGGMPQMSIQEAVKQLDLTAEQQQKVEPILKADTEARQKLTQEMMAAFRGEDEAARTAAREKVQALDTKTMEQLAAVLTKDQAAKVARMTGPGGAFDRFVELVEKLDLSADQKGQVADAVKAANAEAAEKADTAGRVYQAAVTKITGLLTDEQKAQLARLQQAQQLHSRIDRMLANVSLTAEQKAKIAKLVEQAQKDTVAASDRQAQREVMTKLMESVRNDVLTEEQRAKLPAPRAPRARE